MNRYQKDLWDMHASGLFKPAPPTRPTLDGYPTEFRVRLLIEEVLEFADALHVDVMMNGEYDHVIYEDGLNIQDFDDHCDKLGIARDRPPKDMAKAIDALVDILNVTYGAAVAMGIDLEPFWKEVKRANLDKATGRLREDGKRLKPEDWRPPNIEGVLARVLAMHDARCPNESALRRYTGIVLCEACSERIDIISVDALPEAWKMDGRCMAVSQEFLP